MKTFQAAVEERYVWDCPYCGEHCEDSHEDPELQGPITCEHCGKDSECELTER